jgi:hypothetical protein
LEQVEQVVDLHLLELHQVEQILF